MNLAETLKSVRCINDAAKVAPRIAKDAGVPIKDVLAFIAKHRGIHATMEDVRRMRDYVPTWTTDSRGGRWQDRMADSHGHMPNFDRMARGRF
jgi:hypothetical protein